LEFQKTAVREADHRIKNTLQIVGNLLALQSRSASSHETRDALQEAYRRLHVLARLHELLQMSDNQTRAIPMSPLFQTLGGSLRESFGERSADVELRIDVETMVLTEDMAIPLALLANELITNAYKHAFPNGTGGVIELTLKRLPEGFTLKVSDNGIGARSTDEASGLGHKLIRSFSTHLKADLVYSESASGGGMAASVTIAPPESEAGNPVRARALTASELAS
jgi:two-component sensor histidine kinase